MKRLRDAGNSLVVVEHDPQVMFAANRLLDMGPGPGERGGELLATRGLQQMLVEAGVGHAAQIAGALSLGEIDSIEDLGFPRFHNAALVCVARPATS